MAHKWDPICPRPRRLVRPVRTDPGGVLGPTRGQARGRDWRQSSYGYYVPAATDADLPEQRIMEQSVRLPAAGAVTGWASLRLHQATFFDGLGGDGRTVLPVPLAVGTNGRGRGDEDAVISREPLDRSEITICHGIPCTVVRRALFDEMRRTADLREAVVAMDMAAAALLVSVRRMRKYLAARRSWRRSVMVGAALDLADERSRSPNETYSRLIWVLDAGLPPPLVNQPIWDLDGTLLGVADLLDEAAGVVGEYDGAEHRGARRHSQDVAREDRLRRRQLEVFRVTGPDLSDPQLVVDRMLFHRSRAQWLPPDRRPWTLVPPRAWRAEPTLDEYLDERDYLHAFYQRDAEEAG